MNEKSAWMWLAEKWDSPLGMEYCPFVRVGGIDCCGICPCIEGMAEADAITEELSQTMIDKIEKLPSVKVPGFRWPTTIAGAKQRAVFCREQAALLAKGRNP